MFVLISEAMVSEIRAKHLDLLARAKFTEDGQPVKDARIMIREIQRSVEPEAELSPKELEDRIAEIRQQRMKNEAIAEARDRDIGQEARA